MNGIVVVVHLALAILLFYAINWIGRHSAAYGYLQLSLIAQTDQAPAFNFILKALTPTIFIILIAAGCYAINLTRLIPGIWLVTVYYFAFRLLFNLALGRALLLNWLSFTLQTTVGIGAGYLSYKHLILPRRPLFPDLNAIGGQLWIVVALFLYAAFNSIHRTRDESSVRRKKRYIRSRFNTLRSQYGKLIEHQFPRTYMELVAYAVMIYETFNRPGFARVIENALFPWHSRTIGPMQVYTRMRLTNEQSVKLGVEKLKHCLAETEREFQGKTTTRYSIIRSVLAKYNRDEHYIAGVMEVLGVLWSQVASEYRQEFEHMHTQIREPMHTATGTIPM